MSRHVRPPAMCICMVVEALQLESKWTTIGLYLTARLLHYVHLRDTPSLSSEHLAGKHSLLLRAHTPATCTHTAEP